MAVNHKALVETTNTTTPESVAESNEALFHARWNVPFAAKHCGMTVREMKMTFREYLKYQKSDYSRAYQLELFI